MRALEEIVTEFFQNWDQKHISEPALGGLRELAKDGRFDEMTVLLQACVELHGRGAMAFVLKHVPGSCSIITFIGRSKRLLRLLTTIGATRLLAPQSETLRLIPVNYLWSFRRSSVTFEKSPGRPADHRNPLLPTLGGRWQGKQCTRRIFSPQHWTATGGML